MSARARKRARSSFGMAMAIPAVGKVACGALLTILVVTAWQQFLDLEKRQQLMSRWGNVQDYAVFYPRFVGNDRQELENGGNASTITESRDLYPVLDKAGALFVDAVNYEEGVSSDPSQRWPVPPMRVNTNYLKKYPILDESGRKIDIKEDDQSWVVAVPDRFKPLEAELKNLLQITRSGGDGVVGALQAETRMVGERIPEYFTHQDVRIVWMAPGQKVFSFDSKVDPDQGNMITDPIVEIMTPANSLTVDRLNSITGDMNTALKVHVDGDPAGTLSRISPLLGQLKLDDNLKKLVYVHDALGMELDKVSSGVTWVSAFAGGALLVMLVLNSTVVIIGSDRLRRRVTVRRLHGVGFVRSYRELLVVLGATWLAQTLLAGILVGYLSMSSASMPGEEAGPFAQIPKLLAVALAALVVEAVVVFVVATIVERRNAVKRLKEL